MIAPELSHIAHELRQAAARRAYVEVQRLLVAVCQMAAVQTAALPPEDPQIPDTAAWLEELLEWTGIMLRTARAAQADELRRLAFVQNYLR